MKKIIKHWRDAFLFSCSGFKRLFSERAFRQEFIFLPVVLCLLVFVKTCACSVYLLISYVILLITEALNTAIEITINRISVEKHQLSKEAKDVGSSAVAIALVNLAISVVFCLIEIFL